MKSIIFTILLIVTYFDTFLSYSSYMLQSGYCTSKSLSSSSSTIMGYTPVQSTSRTVQLYRGSSLLTSSDTYVPGESLIVRISNTNNNLVFETSAGTFSGSNLGCSSKKTTSSGNTLVMPTSGAVTIKAGWATGYAQVYYNSITISAGQTASPTQSPTQPTKSPTLSPTYLLNAPTPSPTLAPTFSPTLKPTPTLRPTPSSYTLLSFQLIGSIGGASSGALSTTAATNIVKLTIVNAIEGALSIGGLIPYQLYINSIYVSNSAFRRIILQSNSLKFNYTCNYILEQTSYTSPSALASSFSTSVTSNTFATSVVNYLQTSGVSSLSSVTSLSSSGLTYSTQQVVIGELDNTKKTNDYSNNLKVIVAVTIPIGIVGVASVLYYNFHRKEQPFVVEKELKYVQILFIIGIALGIASLILVTRWAKENNYTSSNGDTNYLGSLDWKHDIFSWHPVLMVGGFLVAQVLAPAMWVLFPEKYRNHAKILHVVLQSGGVITVSLGLYAATAAKKATSSPHLVSLHSWIGITAVGSFLLNYIFGAMMRTLSMSSTILKGIALIQAHRKIGLVVLGMTVASILTGISSFLPQGVCNYNGIEMDSTQDSLENFMNIPASCRLANGLGLLVTGSAIFVVIATAKRYRILNLDVISDTSSSYDIYSPIFMTVLACVLSLISLILVTRWAKENNYNSSNGDTNYLGSLDWKHDIFSWHPVLMVGGFLVAQVLAPAMWVLFPEKYRNYAKILHVVLQSGGVITVSLGLYAATAAKKATSSPHLVSLHSWIGIAAISLYAANYMFGLGMASIGRDLGKNLDLIWNHKILGFSSLALSVFAVATGISTKISRGSCDQSSTSCSIGNSIGIVVIIAAIFTVYVATIRTLSPTTSSDKSTIIPATAPSVVYKNIPNNDKKLREIEANKFNERIV